MANKISHNIVLMLKPIHTLTQQFVASVIHQFYIVEGSVSSSFVKLRLYWASELISMGYPKKDVTPVH